MGEEELAGAAVDVQGLASSSRPWPGARFVCPLPALFSTFRTCGRSDGNPVPTGLSSRLQALKMLGDNGFQAQVDPGALFCVSLLASLSSTPAFSSDWPHGSKMAVRSSRLASSHLTNPSRKGAPPSRGLVSIHALIFLAWLGSRTLSRSRVRRPSSLIGLIQITCPPPEVLSLWWGV